MVSLIALLGSLDKAFIQIYWLSHSSWLTHRLFIPEYSRKIQVLDIKFKIDKIKFKNKNAATIQNIPRYARFEHEGGRLVAPLNPSCQLASYVHHNREDKFPSRRTNVFLQCSFIQAITLSQFES